MKHLYLGLVTMSLAFILGFGCGSDPAGEGGPTPGPGNPAPVATGPRFEDVDGLDLRPYRGRVLVLELGCVGCDGSGAALDGMMEISGGFDRTVAFVRIDHGQSTVENAEYYRGKKVPFDVLGDPSGKAGESLPSQAMPTMYLYGKWGQLRYQGGFKADKFKRMIGALAAETKPDKANFFFEAKLDKGEALPPFTAFGFDGMDVEMEAFRSGVGAFVLVFAGTTCPTSKAGVKALCEYAREMEDEDLAILVVNPWEKKDAVQECYESLDAPFPVLLDPEGEIAETYGIEAVPTVFVCGEDGVIVHRSLWNLDAIQQEVNVLLGKLSPEDRKPIEQEGSG